ncbi:hypothetical protein FRC02_008980 [Tulasnella sp. 418]|nr:hypothetical protein FRC02_008980 [Tulasnella sp. 418]
MTANIPQVFTDCQTLAAQKGLRFKEEHKQVSQKLHDPLWICTITVGTRTYGGQGGSIAKARQEAAERALQDSSNW